MPRFKMFCMTCLMWTSKIDPSCGHPIHSGVNGCGGRLIYKEQYNSLKIHFDAERKVKS
jgi:hypothetical protein